MLFEHVKIGRLRLKNRFMRSATYDGGADRSGHVTDWQTRLFESLAKGGVGLIVSGLASVHPTGRISAFQNIVSDDAAIEGLRRLVDVAHANDARIALQLAHCGREAHVYQAHYGEVAGAPSVVLADPHFQYPHRALGNEEILEIVAAFGHAAGRAKAAGFDAVQIHAAHGYLVSEFLSPYTNRRKDRWGGDPASRFRFLAAIYEAVRSAVGDDYPVMVKLGVADGFADGLSFSEGKVHALRAAALGFDALEISQGVRGNFYAETEFRKGIKHLKDEAYFRGWTQAISRQSAVPLIMVGGLRSLYLMETIVSEKQADLVALSRPLIREPDLIDRWQQGDYGPSRCISCNHCFEALLEGTRLCCASKEM
jgi:2,4-dienoyl-CoA reductase-like NADH-dependent reductase (Old Yellow Enzyme family)